MSLGRSSSIQSFDGSDIDGDPTTKSNTSVHATVDALVADATTTPFGQSLVDGFE